MIGAGSTSTAAAYLAGDAGFAPSPPGMGGSRRGGGRFQQQQNDVALFEDDYLSFQGFHSSGDSSSLDSAHNGLGSSGNGSGNGGLRAYYFNSGMSLLRSKRMSSVTDSHSDESVDALQKQALQQQQQQLAMQKQLAMDDSMAHNMSSASACDVVELQVRPRSESLSRRNHRYNVNNNNNANTNSNGLGVLAHKSSKRSLVGGFSGGGGQPVARQRGHGQSGRSGGGNGDGELNRSGRLPMILKLRKWSSLEEQQQSM